MMSRVDITNNDKNIYKLLKDIIILSLHNYNTVFHNYIKYTDIGRSVFNV